MMILVNKVTQIGDHLAPPLIAKAIRGGYHVVIKGLSYAKENEVWREVDRILAADSTKSTQGANSGTTHGSATQSSSASSERSADGTQGQNEIDNSGGKRGKRKGARKAVSKRRD